MGEMLRRLELIAEGVIPITAGRRLETLLTVNDSVAACGSDYYDLNTVLLSGKRLAALGRDASLGIACTTAGLLAPEADPGSPLELKIAPDDRVVLAVHTDLFLDQAELHQWVGLRIADESGHTIATLPFRRPDIRSSWDGRGHFQVELGGLL